MRFVAKQGNLLGPGRLHALVHIFVPRSDAQAKLDDFYFEVRKAVYVD